MDQSTGSEAAEAGRFYDTLWSSGVSAAALANGGASIGQECLLTEDEIAALARRAGLTAGTSVLDIGSGTGGPACYLARELGCHVLGVDVSAVGRARAKARAHDGRLDHLAQFRLGDIRIVELPLAAFDVVIGLDAWCHIPRRAALLQRCAQLLRGGGRSPSTTTSCVGRWPRTSGSVSARCGDSPTSRARELPPGPRGRRPRTAMA